MSDSVASLFMEVDSKDVVNAIKALDRFEKEAKKTDRENTKLTKSNKKLTKSFGGMTLGIKSLSAAIAGISVGAGLTFTVKAFAEFDKGLIGIRKTTGLAGDQLAGLGADIQEISTQLPIATNELLAIAQSAGQLGVTGRKNILAFTKTVGMLGTASDLVGEEAATSLARILNVTGEAASEVDVLGSVIVALGNQMATTEREIARMATEVAQATGIFGVSSAEAAALGAAMRSMGIRAELGGSTVGRAFRTIEASLNSGGIALQNLMAITGMTEAQLKSTFETNATAVFQAFVDGLGRAIKSGQSAASVLGAFGLKGEEVLKTLPALASRSDELARALKIAGKETKNATALTDEALAAAESFSAQLEIVGNELGITAKKIGEELAPAVLEASRAFSDWVDENQGAFREFAQDASNFVDDMTPLAAGLGNILSTTLNGWNQLPTVVQEIGLIGALLGGAKAKAAILIASAAIGKMDELYEKSNAFYKKYDDNESLQLANARASLIAYQEILRDNPGLSFARNRVAELTATVDAIESKMQAATLATMKAANDSERAFAILDKNLSSRTSKDYGIQFGPDLPKDGIKIKIGADTKDYKKQFDQQFKDYLEYNEKRLEAREDLQDKINKLTLTSFDYERKQIKKQAAEYKKAGLTETEVAAWVATERARISKEETEDRIEKAKEARDKVTAYLEDYAEAAQDTESQIASATKNAMKEMEDALVDFVKTGKLEFGSLVDSILTDIIRIQVQKNITGPLADYSSSFLGDMFSGIFQAKGGAWSNGVQMFASGGIVNSPTAFGTSSGPGVMGEAGPEVIAPLRRDSKGNMGVSAVAANVNVYVENAPEGTTTTRQQNNQGGEDIRIIIADVVDQNISAGRHDKTFSSNYGIERQGF